MIKQFFLKNQLTLVFALVAGASAYYFYAQSNKPVAVEIVIELIDPNPGIVRLFCANAGGQYENASKQLFNYDEKTRITGNTYRLTAQLPCDVSVNKLGFGPMWAEGHVVIKKFSLKKFFWTEVDLQNEFDHSMKILKGVEKFYMAEDGLHIESLASDPFIEMTGDLQQHTKLSVTAALLLVMLYTLLSFVLLRMLIWLFSTLMNNGLKIEQARLRGVSYLDGMMSNSRNRIFNRSAKKTRSPLHDEQQR